MNLDLVQQDTVILDVFEALSTVQVAKRQSEYPGRLTAGVVGCNHNVSMLLQQCVLALSRVFSLNEIKPSELAWVCHVCDVEPVLPLEFRLQQVEPV